jgi:hypothetical protein
VGALACVRLTQLDIEIWPTCIVVPPGYRVALTVQGSDYKYEGELGELAETVHYTGCGPFLHDDPNDRPRELAGTIRRRLHTSILAVSKGERGVEVPFVVNQLEWPPVDSD